MTDTDAHRLTWRLARLAAEVDITIGKIIELPPDVLAGMYLAAAALNLHAASNRLEQALYEVAAFSPEKIAARRLAERAS